MSRRRLDALAVLGLFAFAFLVRVAYLREARAAPLFDLPVMDARAYLDWADRLAGGDWLGDDVFYQAPLYPYFLGVLRRLGADLEAIRLVQAALGAGACVFTCLAGWTLFSRGVGLLAGALLAVYPPAVFHDGLIQKASLGLFLASLLLWLLARFQTAPSARRALGAGFMVGLLALVREPALLLLPVLAAWIPWRWRGAERRRGCALAEVLALVAGAALALLPVAWRNGNVGGELALTTSQAGPNFWIGNHAGAPGVYVPLRPGRGQTRFEREDAFALAELACGRALTPREVSRYWFGEAAAFVQEQPGAFLALLAQKAFLLCNAYEVPDAEVQAYYERHAPLLALLPLHFGVLLPLAVAGMLLSRRRDVVLLHSWLATFAAGVVAFYVLGRYRLPIVPVLALFAAVFLQRAAVDLRAGRARALAAPALALALAAVLANWPAFDRDAMLATAHVNAGSALLDAGRPGEAIEAYEEALALAPDQPDAHAGLGVVLARTGRMEEAVRELRTAERVRPDDAYLAKRLGTALAETGDWEGAAEHLAHSLALFPADVEAASNLTVALTRLERWQVLREHLEARLARAPAEAGTRAALAWLLATCPDADVRDGRAAVEHAERLRGGREVADPATLDVLAAAYAEDGRFADAVRTARRALSGARGALADAIGYRLKSYEAGEPYHGH